MPLIKITDSQHITLKDGTSGYKISCMGKQSDALSLEPNKNYWFSKKNEIVGSEIQGLFLENSMDVDTWELYGSDHNTVNVLYGLTKDIDNIEGKLESKVQSLVNSLNNDEFDNDLIMFSKWDFPDETSLIILHFDNELYNFNLEDLNLKKSNLITVVAGAEVDDICLAEIVGSKVEKFLSKFKIINNDIDPDDFKETMESFCDYADETLKFNDSKLNNKSKELFLQMANHLFNNIVNFSTSEDSENIYNVITAKKLTKYFELSKIIAPIDNEITELKLVNENSNKFYNVEFQVANNEYTVNIHYGKVGNVPQTIQKIKTTDLASAQQTYLSIVDNQFSKGYEFNKPINKMKLK